MSNTPWPQGADYITVADLRAIGWTAADVRRRFPWLVEYVALDRQPCWLAGELRPLIEEGKAP